MLILPSTLRTDPSLSDILNSGWVRIGSSGEATYVSGTSFSVDGDYTAYFTRGRKIRLYHHASGVYKYVRVVSSSYGSSITTVVVNGDTLLNEQYDSIWSDLSPISYAQDQALGSDLTEGDILYADANKNLKALPIGPNGAMLIVDSSSHPSYLNPGNSGEVLITDPTGYPNYIPDGRAGMINGKITTSVASNNLTVAIKTLAGTDPSTTDPVYIRIDNTIRAITAALSVTLAAGTNWFSSGSNSASDVGGLSGFEVDYFLYAFWNTNTTSVTLGFARIPFAITYGGFNATNTHQAYCGISSTAPASTDVCQVIGRFNATLSATPSFNWSIPATSVIVQQPVYQTRLLSFTPGYANGTNAPGNATRYGRYVINGQTLDQYVDFTWGNTTVFNVSFRIYGMWLYDSVTYSHAFPGGSVYAVDAGTNTYSGYSVNCSPGSGFFEARTGSSVINATTPFTWTTNDVLTAQWRTLINAS